MTAPNNIIIRQDLTTYAFALMQDLKKILAAIKLFAPVVPTGSTSGRYNLFDTTQSFKEYAKAQRAVGGQSNIIGFLSSTANFNADPFGLKIGIDEHEFKAAGDAGKNLLEQGKTRTLTVNCLVAHLSAILTAIKASVSATSGMGSWQDPDVDPIAEINALIKSVWLATGIVPNNVAIDFGAWCVLASHPKVLARMPGADLAKVNIERIQGLLLSPDTKVSIIETAVLTGGGLGNTSATKKGIMNGSVLAFYNSEMATPYDASFCKTFSPSAQLFTDVYTYEEAPHVTWYENNWTADIQVVASALCKRIDVTGASEV